MVDAMLKKKLLLSVTASVVGVGLVLFGSWKIYVEIQRMNSPLDRVGVVEINPDESIERQGMDPDPSPDRNFLPILSQPERAASSSAPEIGEVHSPGDDRVIVSQGNAAPLNNVRPIVEPKRVIIPALQIDTNVIPVAPRRVDLFGASVQQWQAPGSGELGWHESSAKLGQSGNTVINGHSSGYGDTFRDLETLDNGDLIQVYSGDVRYTYVVANRMVLKERWEPIEVRMENARWISRSDDERLTLISCWPSGSNTHRVVVVATPLEVDYPDQFLFSGDGEAFSVQ